MGILIHLSRGLLAADTRERREHRSSAMMLTSTSLVNLGKHHSVLLLRRGPREQWKYYLDGTMSALTSKTILDKHCSVALLRMGSRKLRKYYLDGMTLIPKGRADTCSLALLRTGTRERKNYSGGQTQCSQWSRGPTGPGGRTAKSPGPDRTAENMPSSSAKSKDGRLWRGRRARQSET